jgi:hypothetical protein
VAAAWSGSGHDRGLLHGTNTIRLTAAALLTGAGVVAVATAMGRKHVWERCSIADFVGVNTIANAGTELHRIDEDAGDGARGDVNDIVDGPPSLRESGKVARQKAESLSVRNFQGIAGIVPRRLRSYALLSRK